jgi:hypothetical protein
MLAIFMCLMGVSPLFRLLIFSDPDPQGPKLWLALGSPNIRMLKPAFN